MHPSGTAPPRANATAETARDADARLVRAIGPWALAANTVNLTVGAGIFALPAVVAAILGPAALIAYLICGALILLVLTCFAEIGSQVTRSGGVVAYIEAAFGPFAGFLAWVVWGIGFSIAADAAIASFLADSLTSVIPLLAHPVARIAFFAIVFGGLALVNIRGVRAGTGVSVVITIAKLVPLLLIIALGAFSIRAANLAWSGWPTLAEVGTASLTLFFAFAGAESALTPSGEIRDPARTVPRGLLGGALAIVLLYLALHLTAQGVLGADLAAHPAAPLAAVAERIAGPVGASVVIGSVTLAIFGALACDMIGSPRALLAEAEAGALPRVLTIVHPRYRTPWVAIAVFAATTFLVAATGAFTPLAVLSSMALLLAYLGVCLAALRFRYTRPRAPGSFRAPGGPTVALLAAAAVVWLLAHSTLQEALSMAALIAAAALYYAIRRLRVPVDSSADIPSSESS